MRDYVVRFRNPNSLKEGGAEIRFVWRAKDKATAIEAAKTWMNENNFSSWVCVTFP